MGKYCFKIYVTGQNSRSQQAIGALQQLCEQRLAGLYELSVVDVLELPDAAEAAKILATPTVIRELPPPPRRVVGDLSHTEQVLAHLGVAPLGGADAGPAELEPTELGLASELPPHC